MGQIFKGRIDSFYGGMSDDVRIQRPEISALLSNFDIYSKPKRLTPYPSFEADETTSYEIVMFLYDGSTLFGLGIVASSAKVKIYYKQTDAITGSWAALTNGESSSGARFERGFLGFHGYGYGGTASRIWAVDLSGGSAFTETAYSTAGVPICQGIITTDDKMIWPCSAGIAVKDGAGSGPTNAWSTFSLIPAAYTASDIVERGDYVYIAAYPTNLTGTSKVFVWDKVSDDVSDIIDFGEGRLLILDDIDGELVGISNNGLSSFVKKARVVFRTWSGGNKARPIYELIADNSSASLYGNHCKFREGSKLVFGLSITLDGTAYNQLFSIGRKSSNYPLAVALDRKIDNDTALVANIQGIYKIGDYVFAAHNQNGSVNRTDDGANPYLGTATIITQKLNGSIEGGPDVARHRKKLSMAGIQCAPVNNSTSKLTLYVRFDEETSWTKVREYTEANGTGFESGMADTNADGSPDTEFPNCYEFQFKLEHSQASGAAPKEPTAIIYAFEDLDAEIQSE